jgi:hypothetical protein
MSRGTTFKKKSRPTIWNGFYARIPGKSPIFHARSDGSGDIEWSPWRSDETLKSTMAADSGVIEMIEAINQAKSEKTGSRGGSFHINEYGQVLVPIAQSQDKYLVGELSGYPEFVDPRSGRHFSLAAPRAGKTGAAWDFPYVGMPFKFNSEGQVSRVRTVGDISELESPLRHDSSLAAKLTQLRPTGGRMLINLHGVILTKMDGEKPIFVGEIDPNKWFTKTN